MTLELGPGLALPADGAVTQTFAILAKRGAGKTHTAKVMAEELLEAGQQIVAVDPIGGWWGLRAGKKGQGGYPVVVAGGDHADVPLEATSGRVMAEFVVEADQSVILDLSHFRKGDQRRFMTEFLETLYHANRAPLHLFLDEADAFAPQRPQRGTERLLGATEDVVRRGRARGLGITMISQRAAVLNKNILTQTEVLVVLQTTAPQDRKAIQEWVEANGTPEQWRELRDSLASLGPGEAWFWSPGWLDAFSRVQVRELRTIDSSATPSQSARGEAPQTLVPVDLEALTRRIQDTIERAKVNDPKYLRKRIQELEWALAKAEKEKPPPERVEVPAVSPENIQAFWEALDRVDQVAGQIDAAGAQVAAIGREISGALARVTALQPVPAPAPARQPRDAAPPSRRRSKRGTSAGESVGQGGIRRMLVALAQRPRGLTRAQLGVRASLSVRSGTFSTYLRTCRSNGWIDESGDLLRITDEGLEAVGDYEPLPTGADLLEHWLSQFGGGGKARMLRALADAYPRALTRDELGERAEISPGSGTFSTYLRLLRRLELVEGRRELRASQELFS